MNEHITNVQLNLTEELIHKIIDNAMGKKDRYISIYSGEYGTTLSIYPLDEDEEDF